MSEHVFARVSGRGLTIVPRAPFRFQLTDDGIELHHETAKGERSARVSPETGGKFGVKLAKGTKSLEEVADVVAGPARDEWWIETTHFMARWPAGFTLVSRPEPPGFDLVGEGDTLVYPQGPLAKAPPEDRFAAPGQKLARKGKLGRKIRWVELVYEHDGHPWTQRHYVVPLGDAVLLVTLQASSSKVRPAIEAGEELARSIAPFEGDPRPLSERS